MISANYKVQYGYYKTPEGTKIYICESNGMWADVSIIKNDKGKKRRLIYGFWLDNYHMKRYLDNSPQRYVGCKFVFYAAIVNNSVEKENIWKAIQMLTEHGAQVVIK